MSEMECAGDGYSRRQVVLGLGTGLVGGLTGCSELASNDTEPSTAATDTRSQESTTGTRLEEQFSAVRSATNQYADVAAARRDGYAVLGPDMAGMGWHLIDQRRVEDAVKNGFSRENPPLLTYLQTEDELSLGSVEYAAPVAALEENPDIFDDESADATETWNTHHAATHVFATPDSRQTAPERLDMGTVMTSDNWAEFRPADTQLASGDTISLDWGSTEGKAGTRTERVVDAVITHPDLRTLHVWLHEDNPNGVFSEHNPRFGGGGDGHHHDDRHGRAGNNRNGGDHQDGVQLPA